MGEFKEDLRIQKTRRDLRKAILDLIKIKKLEKITVTEICDAALVNRMTFYKYYEDKYILLDDAFQAIRDEMISSFPRDNITSIDDALNYCTKLVNNILHTINSNVDLLKALITNGNDRLSRIIINVAEDSIQNIFEGLNKLKPLKHPIPLLTAFVFGGFSMSIQYYIEHSDEFSLDVIEKTTNDLRELIVNSDIIFA